MAISLERVAIGFAIGGGFGLVLALVAGLSRFGENTVDPIMQALRTLALFGLILVFIVWFGIGEPPKITLIALAAVIPLYLNTFVGIRGVDGKLAELGKVLGLRRSKVLGLRRSEMIRDIVLPGALPMILVGLRQSLGVARTGEFLSIVRGAWSGKPYDFRGDHYHVQGSTVMVPASVTRATSAASASGGPAPLVWPGSGPRFSGVVRRPASPPSHAVGRSRPLPRR
jgi:sulfonate transport system permease protein